MKKLFMTMALALMTNLTVNATDCMLIEIHSPIICELGDPTPEELIQYALDEALQNIPEGSIIALDQIRTEVDYISKNEIKDIVIERLLNNGYRVIAKEYMEKLYEEQQAQQSGIYNDRTTVKENNFSAVGYYMNVSYFIRGYQAARVQVINVSTGEYVSQVTLQ